MTHDRELEVAEQRLFRAARRESPDPTARERTLAALLGARPGSEIPRLRSRFPRRLAYAAALAAAAAIVILIARLERTKEPWFSATAEPVSARPAGEPAPPAASEPASSVSPPSSAPTRGIRSASPKSAPPEPSLTAEVEALDEARRALREGDPARALRSVDDYDRILHGTRLRDEAMILRIEALERSGQREAAAKLGAEFVANSPNSPLVDRARGLVSSGHESVETRGAGGGGEP